MFSGGFDADSHLLEIGNPSGESETTKLVEGFDCREALSLYEIVVDSY